MVFYTIHNFAACEKNASSFTRPKTHRFSAGTRLSRGERDQQLSLLEREHLE